MSEEDVDEFLTGYAEFNPHVTIEQFKIEFKEAVSRAPTLKEINKYMKFAKKAADAAKLSESSSSSSKQESDPDPESESEPTDKEYPVSFISKLVERGVTYNQNLVMFTDNFRNVSVDLVLIPEQEKIYVLDLVLKGWKTCVGLILNSFLPILRPTSSPYQEKGTCVFVNDGAVTVGAASFDSRVFWEADHPTRVSLELDCSPGVRVPTLRCFVAGRQLKPAVTLALASGGFEDGLRFLLGGSDGATAQVTALRTAAATMVEDGLEYTEHLWEP